MSATIITTTGPGATRATRFAVIGLLAVTAAWGSTFVLLDDVTSRIPAADYLTLRFGLATLVLAALRPAGLTAMPGALRRRAVVLGLLFGVANLLLVAGLAHTTASVSGFVTGMYVVFTPLFGAALLRHRVRPGVWGGVALATTGLGVISLNGASVGRGELITLAGAAVCALQILALGRWADARFAIEMAAVQSASTAAVSALFALPGGITLPSTRSDTLVLIYMAVVVGAVTMTLQTWAQSKLHPARAAVVMTLEPVWAAVFAIMLGGEAFTLRLAVGGVLVLSAMYLCERSPATPAAPAAPGTPAAPHVPGPRRAWRSLPLPRR